MKKQTYDDELLTRYLLGSLGEQETERLDQLSFTDDEIAARLQVVENDLVDAYVRGELSGQTLERFSLHYLSSPRRREKVAFARGLQSFASRAVVTGQAEKQQRAMAEPSVKSKPAPQKSFLRRHFFVSGSALQWGLAVAALIVLAAGGWLLFENLRLRNQMNQAQTEREQLQKRKQELESQLGEQQSIDSEKEKELASLRQRLAQLEQQSAEQSGGEKHTESTTGGPNIATFVLAPQTRGGSQPTPVRISADAVYVRMQLELEPNDFASYRAELKTQSGTEVVWRSGRLRTRTKGDGKQIVVRLRAALLKSQIYVLEVYGASPAGASEIISSYPFRVEK